MPKAATSHRIAILAAALLFSTGGAAIKQCALSGWQVASFRSAVAALVLMLIFPATRRGWSKMTWLVGCAYAATMILFVLGNKLTTAANTIFLQSTAPLYVLLLAPWLLKERARRSDLLLMLVIVAGLALVVVDLGASSRTAPHPMRGNVLAAAAGVSWALTLLGLRRLERHAPPSDNSGLRAVVVGNVLAAAIALPFALPLSPTATASLPDWGIILYLGAVQIGLAYVLLTYGFRHVPAFEGSLLILIAPIFSPLWAWLFHGEIPGGWAVLGGVLILGASTMKTWLDQRSNLPNSVAEA